MDTYDYACDYLDRGWAVFPLWGVNGSGCHCGDRACPSPGKHPCGELVPHGVKDATTSYSEFTSWYDQYPAMNLGIATGAVSGIVVLDVDMDKGGEESYAALLDRYYPRSQYPNRSELPCLTAMVVSGGGGMHFYYRHPGHEVRNSSGSLGKGIDVRGDGGSIVAPPSVHASGEVYHWDAGWGFGEDDIVAMPDWLTARAVPRPPVVIPPSSFSNQRLGPPIRDGQRNTELARIAGAIHARGASHDHLRVELQAVNQQRCHPPLPPGEVDQIALSISRYPR